MSASKCIYRPSEVSKRCSKPAEESGYCVLHDPNPLKDSARVREMISAVLEREEQIADFTGCHFYEIENVFDSTQTKEGVFDFATFHRNVDFSQMKFRIGWSFRQTRFEGNVKFSGLPMTGHQDNLILFDGAVFGKKALFQGTNFTSTPIFRGVEFRGGANFTGAVFGHEPVFTRSKFLGNSTFQGTQCKRFSWDFTGCDLSHLRVTSLPNFPRGYTLIDVTWNFGWWHGRPRIFEEVTEGNTLRVLNVYRQLHHYYYNKQAEFNQSRGFYVSFMIMQRKVLKKLWGKPGRRFRDAKPGRWFTDIIYWSLSRYGESFPRPLVVLLAIWFCLPLIIQRYIDPPCVDPGYWSIFWDNLMASTMYRSLSVFDFPDPWPKRLVFVETILNALFIGFLALAIRRSFVPKKPMDSQDNDSGS